MSRQVAKGQPNYGIVCARGLGDALLSMILAHNLKCSGMSSVIYSTILCQLKEWFPEHQILPYPTQADFFSTFSSFETLIAADHSIVCEKHSFNNRLIFLKESKFDKKKSMVENLTGSCKELLALSSVQRGNGITPPKGKIWQRYPKRVILHPMSADEKKNWPAEKFIQLFQALKKKDFDPYICVSPAERELWQNKIGQNKIEAEALPLFAQVSDLAAFVYESGYMIGNDSGVGHLASCLNIPTLSLFCRESYSRLWRPGWGLGEVVTPLKILPGAHLKERFWKQLLSVSRVKKAFFSLSKQTIADKKN